MIATLVFADDKAASLRKNTYDTIPRAQSLLSLRDSHQPMQVSGCQMDNCVIQFYEFEVPNSKAFFQKSLCFDNYKKTDI